MPALILVFGLPGSGKSTLAARLARKLPAERFSSDEVRAQLGLRGDYSDASISAVYRAMFERAGEALAVGRDVILDGSFSSKRFRQSAQAVASENGGVLVLIRMTAGEKATLRRVGRKRRHSEAGPEAYRLLRENFDPVEGDHLCLDSSSARPKQLLSEALDYVSSQL